MARIPAASLAVAAVLATLLLGSTRTATGRTPSGHNNAKPVSVEVRGRVRTSNTRSPLDDWVAVGQLATAIVAVLGVPFVLFQIRSARQAARNERTAKFVERYTQRDFQGVASRTLSYLRVKDAAE